MLRGIHYGLTVSWLACAGPAFACPDLTDIIEAVPTEQEADAYQADLTDCLDVLLEQQADGRPDVVLNDVLEFAAVWGNPYAAAAILERGADPDGNIEMSARSPLQVATTYGNHAVMMRLIEAGADPNAGQYDTPVIIALRQLDAVALEMLLAAGGELRLPDDAPDSWTLFDEVLYHSEGGGNVVRLMLANGIDPMAPMLDGFTPIHVAARLGNLDIVRALVEAGVPVDVLNAQGQTPLERAAGDRWGLPMVALLLELGADPAANRGAAPVEAWQSRREDIFTYMALIGQPERQQRVLDQTLTDAAISWQPYAASALVEMGADPNWAVGVDHILNRVDCQPELGRRLIALGADPALARMDGPLPAWVIACAGYSEDERAYLRELGYADLP